MQGAPALHPERIRSTLRVLKEGIDRCGMSRELTLEETETCRAALELVRKGQLAVGITGNVADAGVAMVKLIEALHK